VRWMTWREIYAGPCTKAGEEERRALARALAAAGDRRRESGDAATATGLYSRALPLLEELEVVGQTSESAGASSAERYTALLEISRVVERCRLYPTEARVERDWLQRLKRMYDNASSLCCEFQLAPLQRGHPPRYLHRRLHLRPWRRARGGAGGGEGRHGAGCRGG
jgi:hypothetical protein